MQKVKIIQRKITGPHDAPEQVYRADRLITGSCADLMLPLRGIYAVNRAGLCLRCAGIMRSIGLHRAVVVSLNKFILLIVKYCKKQKKRQYFFLTFASGLSIIIGKKAL
ncbi:hypothetical protein BACCOPRO_00975 [Phocaeicola coprophilus DSM 18228 = JCM 13818]|uniref:Uncharacterized protein n=1 Tax=Phocaeicola coprophilus DSM 18228 = JCM 13818 TaxID=547042 RepID=S0FAB9_9BACT|nr:hypothetical protein BACCOPRO_00975 [Phocaeicola coprophilus DSM 18228 = JCM 13818]